MIKKCSICILILTVIDLDLCCVLMFYFFECLLVKEKTEKKKAKTETALYGKEHQIACGIKDGYVRKQLCLCRTIWLAGGGR